MLAGSSSAAAAAAGGPSDTGGGSNIAGPSQPPTTAQAQLPSKRPRLSGQAASKPTAAADKPWQRSVFHCAGFTRTVQLRVGNGTKTVALAPPELLVLPFACKYVAFGCEKRFKTAGGAAGHEEWCTKQPAEEAGSGAREQALLVAFRAQVPGPLLPDDDDSEGEDPTYEPDWVQEDADSDGSASDCGVQSGGGAKSRRFSLGGALLLSGLVPGNAQP